MLKRIYSHLGWMVFPFAIAGIITLSLLDFLLWRQSIGDFKLRTTTDFVAFYPAGWIARTEGASQVYNLVSQKAVEESVLGSSILLDEVNPFVHPPFVVPLLRLIVQSDYVSSYQNWALVMSALFVISEFILILSLPNISKKESLLLFSASLLFFPGMVSILNGQDSAILFLGGAIWMYGLVLAPTLAAVGAIDALVTEATIVVEKEAIQPSE